jgi:formate C-acetyltransferase
MFDARKISAPQLLEALAADFEGHENLQRMLIEEAPKFGNDDDTVRGIAHELSRCLAEEIKCHRNERGGIYRSGISSAPLYIWQGKEIGATADGRKAKEPLAPNFSPAMGRARDGLTTVIRTFAQHDLTDLINGGPLTIEIHDSAFQTSDAYAKMAALIRTFVELGGMQMQVNTVNRQKLIDAQAHPEKYRNLIVRVWGFSAYFVELERDFQDHIISRTEHVFN